MNWNSTCVLRTLVVLVAAAFLGNSANGADKPNILFIFADDQCHETIHALGNAEIKTPNLDRLSRQSVTFTHAYNQGSWSGAVCVASRTMLNTGRFLWHANDVYAKSEEERQAGRFWSEYMKQAGYRTYMTGKWHVRADAAKAFDVTGSVRGGMPNQTGQGYNRPIEGQPIQWKPWDEQFGGYWKGGKHWSEVVGDETIEFLNQAKDSEQPFFMYIAFNAPHDPRQSPKEFVDKYPLDKISVPDSFLAEYPYKDAIGCGRGLRDEKLAPFPRTEYAVKVNRQEYYAIITHMDAQIGRILDALQQSGKADNTYVFFSADHGLAVGNHGLLGKQNMYDHSIRVPLMVSGPGVDTDRRTDGTVYLQDIMATSLELAGVAKPDHVEFRSLLPILRGERERNYDAVYGAYLGVQRCIIEDGFKLILYPKVPKARLFDLKNDPDETNDLIEHAKHQATAKKLFATFLRLQKETGDTLELEAAFSKL